MRPMRMMGHGIGTGLLVLALLTMVAPVQVAAQVVARQECRCVDQDGNVIENCTCIRSGDLDVTPFGLTSFDRRAQIGVYIDATQDDSEVGGARITDVREGGPAWEAGIREGDVIVSVAGRSVTTPLAADAEDDLDDDESLAVQRFIRIVGELEPDEEVDVTFLRDGQRRTVSVRPERATGLFSLRAAPRAPFFDARELREMEGGLREMEDELRGMTFRFEARDLDRLRGLSDSLRGMSDSMRHELRGLEFDVRGMAPHLDSLRTRIRARAPEGSAVFFRERGPDPCFTLRSGSSAGGMLTIGGSCIDGVEFTEMNQGLSIYFGTSEGVLVTDVAEGASLGLEPGDVVMEVDDRAVETPADVRRILASFESDETVVFRIRRQGSEMQVSGTRRGN